MIYLAPDQKFPDVSQATQEGLLAIGGDLSVDRLLHAYHKGIFPWFDNDQPILWWSPDPRFVLFPNKLKVSKSMKQTMGNNEFEVTINKAFSTVIQECASVKRQGQTSTWITTNMIEAYCMLHDRGHATSVEVWLEGALVGGLYGIDLKNGVFCGESMFTKVNNASKVGFITFVQQTNYKLIDCQVYTDHLSSLGAEDISRNEFLSYLN